MGVRALGAWELVWRRIAAARGERRGRCGASEEEVTEERDRIADADEAGVVDVGR